MSDLRTIHAVYDGMQIVRYDRAGHWFLEPRSPMLARQRVSVLQAARSAAWGEQRANGHIFTGKPGGRAFDRQVKLLRLGSYAA